LKWLADETVDAMLLIGPGYLRLAEEPGMLDGIVEFSQDSAGLLTSEARPLPGAPTGAITLMHMERGTGYERTQ
jgi:hypothetical protein